MSVIKPTEMLRDTEGAKGTPLYMAPEIMLQEEYDEKADVYRWAIPLTNPPQHPQQPQQ